MFRLNPILLERQRISEPGEEYILSLHRMRAELFKFSSTLNINDEDAKPIFKQLPAMLGQIEFAMQRAWKFPEESKFHTWWHRIPHCTCPNMDNDELQGRDQRIYNLDCPLHGGC